MIRIAGVQHGDEAGGEFLLLQNQGAMRVRLAGHLVASDAFTHSGAGACHLFLDDEWIGPGQFVILHSAFGDGRWTVSRDGSRVYVAFAGPGPHWGDGEPIHVLAIQHTYARQREPLRV